VWAVTLVAFGMLALAAGFLAAVLPPIAEQVGELIKHAPTYLQDLRGHSGQLGHLDAKYHIVDKIRERVADGSGIAVGGVIGVGTAVFSATASLVTVIVLTLYFLANLPGFKAVTWRMVPATRRVRVAELGDQIFDQIGGYILGNVFTSLVAGAGTYIFLLIVGVPYPLALGMVVAVFDLIPVVGSTIAGAAVSLVALTVSVPVAALTLGYYIVYRLMEDYLLSPRVMRRAVDVPPFLTIIALLLGAALAGMVGAFLAIPVAAAIQLIFVEVIWPQLDRS
jgi:predicted PurR-regulated permease PerM